MRREASVPRLDLAARYAAVEASPADGPSFYQEDFAYVFSEAEIETLHAAAAEIEGLVRQAVGHAIEQGRLPELGVPPALIPLIERDWRFGAPSLYGRYDLAFDGRGPPKLLEYNADTPTALFEAAILQWEWLQARHPEGDQYNSIHEALVAAWGVAAQRCGQSKAHLAGHLDESDDRITLIYLLDCALQAGLEATLLDLRDLGWNGAWFTDLEDRPVDLLFKLYPWDWLAEESFFPHITTSNIAMLEPAWRAVAANKGLLAILWELNPGHPNLLPAAFDPASLGAAYVSKPIYGREGQNVAFHGVADAPLNTSGDYANQKLVFQAYHEIAAFDGMFPVIGAWMIAGAPHGIGVREEARRVTGPGARFTPHRIG